VPYYIMRYGFYEGHTDYRADPVAISFIFGLKSLQEIEVAFEGILNKVLTEHFTRENISLGEHKSNDLSKVDGYKSRDKREMNE